MEAVERADRNPEKEARELERRAKALEHSSADQATALYRDAAAFWQEACEGKQLSAFAASRFLTCARKARAEMEPLVDQARGFIERFPADPFVRSGRAWILYQFAKERLEAKQLLPAIQAVEQALDDCSKIPDPEMLIGCLFRVLQHSLKETEGRHDQRASVITKLADILRRSGSLFTRHLSPNPERGAESNGGRKAPSRLEQFFFMARRVGKDLPDGALLETFMSEAAKAFPRNEWFAEAFIHAALLRQEIETARQRGTEAFRTHPESWGVAAIRAEVEETAGDGESAVQVLRPACLGADQPWPWAALAGIHERRGENATAAVCLACGLAQHRYEDASKVWRLHHRRAELLAGLGKLAEAAREAWLAKESRELGGWKLAREQEELLARHGGPFAEVFAGLDDRPKDAVRRQAVEDYWRIWQEHVRGLAEQGKVDRYDEARGFGFVEIEDGRKAFLHKSVAGRQRLLPGQRVHVVVVESFDRKKGKPGWKVVWLDPAKPAALSD